MVPGRYERCIPCYTRGWERCTSCYTRGWERYTCIYTLGMMERYTLYIHPLGMMGEVHPGIYHLSPPRYTLVYTTILPVYTSMLTVDRCASDDALGSGKEKPLGESLSSLSGLLFL